MWRLPLLCLLVVHIISCVAIGLVHVEAIGSLMFICLVVSVI